MTEAADAFWHMQGRSEHFKPWNVPADVPALWRVSLITMWPVVERGPRFEMHPRPLKAAKSALRWVFAVREAIRMNDLVDPCGEIIDLVAVGLDFATATGTLLGEAAVLGVPDDPSFAVEPVRVFSTVRAWMRANLQGAVLVGDMAARQHWLRGCVPGLVADSVAHAEALNIQMRRPVPKLPPLMVAA